MLRTISTKRRLLRGCLLSLMCAWGLSPDEIPSACSNGPSGAELYGFACPSMGLLSDPMIEAALSDGFTTDQLLYGVAGSSTDQECGKCYQIRLLDAEQEWRPDFPLLVVQVFNFGYDVYPFQFDVFMGGGGFGYFTACNSDCGERSCQGGNCHEAMYTTPFEDWVHAEFSDPNPCYSGGAKWLHGGAAEACRVLAGGSRATQDSCTRTNEQWLHQNFVSLKTTRVQCPPGLIRETGLRRADDAQSGLPFPRLDLQLDSSCVGDRSQGRYCMTTMQDCCKPSCSWLHKVDTDPLYPFIGFCFQNETRFR